MMLIPLTYFLVSSNSSSFFPTYLAGLSVIFLIGSKELNSVIRSNKRELVLLCTFFAYMSFNSVQTDNMLNSLKPLGYSLLILTFICSIPLLNRAYAWFVPSFLNLLVICTTLSSIVSIWGFYYLGIQTPVGNRLVAMGGLDNPVLSALSFSPISIICAFFALKTKNLLLRTGYLLCFVMIFTAIVLTGTRSAFLGLFFTLPLMIYFFVMNNDLRYKAWQVGIICSVCVCILLLIFVGMNLDSLVQRSFSFRPEIWKATLVRILDNDIWFGSGLMADAAIQQGNLMFKHPHNIYLATLFYGGIVGLAGFFLVIFSCLKHQFSNMNEEYGSLAVILLLFGLISLTFDGNRIIRKIDFIWLTIWLPISIGMVMPRTVKE